MGDESSGISKQEFRIINRGVFPLEFHLEPWGDEVLIPPGFFLKIRFFGGFDMEPFEVAYGEKKVVAYFNSNTLELDFSLESSP